MSPWRSLLVIAFALTVPAAADTLLLADGTQIEGCYVRDEGWRLLVWNSLQEVGGPAVEYPRHEIDSFTVSRGEEWDAHPSLPDLSVTFIEMSPMLAGLHGIVNYDETGAPTINADIPATRPKQATDPLLEPEVLARNLKLSYAPGEEIVLTAHVRNMGFATASPFEYEWLIDDAVVAAGRHHGRLAEMEQASFEVTWNWQEGEHYVTFRVHPADPEIASINDTATDAMHAWPFVFFVQPALVDAWHQNRTAYGTFSFEDFYRWHVDIMNGLFAASRYPGAPDGIRARVRLGRIAYVRDSDDPLYTERREDGVLYNQGQWDWCRDADTDRVWDPPTHEWRNQTEWSLPHELGHQLGLVDWYNLDCEGVEWHTWPDSGKRVSHFQRHPMQMMHWHGPHLWGEVDAYYLNDTWNMPRGHFGDHYFAIPGECFLRVVDVNGEPVADAQVEVFQRGAEVDPAAAPQQDHGVTYYRVVEDGNFDRPVSRDPVIVGTTDADGLLRLPNRPVREVITLNGYHRRPNPFGNINVVGNRGLLLVRVTKSDRPCYYWLEAFQFNAAWFRGERDRFTIPLPTPYAGEGCPVPPKSVAAERTGDAEARVTWAAGAPRSLNVLDRAIGFRIYRRISDDGLNDRPWFEVATVGPEAREAVVDLTQYPDDTYWYGRTERFAVSAIGECGRQSELVEVVLAEP